MTSQGKKRGDNQGTSHPQSLTACFLWIHYRSLTLSTDTWRISHTSLCSLAASVLSPSRSRNCPGFFLQWSVLVLTAVPPLEHPSVVEWIFVCNCSFIIPTADVELWDCGIEVKVDGGKNPWRVFSHLSGWVAEVILVWNGLCGL